MNLPRSSARIVAIACGSCLAVSNRRFGGDDTRSQLALIGCLAMARRPFTRFLLSANAIHVHLLCITLIVVLSISLWTGDAQPDYGWGLLFTIVVYPIVLGLMWWSEHLEERAEVEHVVESLTAPDRLRRKRRWWRRAALAALTAVAAGLVYAGYRGLQIDFLPAQYLGYFLFGFAALGAAGVNIWYGGPLDPRMDPPPETDTRDPDLAADPEEPS